MNILEFLKDNIVFLDGGMGTLLQEAGLKPGELPERWNLSHADEIVKIHRAYFEAGTNVVLSNTFGANCLKFEEDELKSIIEAAISNAREASKTTKRASERFVALDMGPIGRLLKPYGDFEFEEAVKVFAKTVQFGAAAGADLIFIETMNDSYETKAALLAAKENSNLPVFVSNAYGSDGKLMTGASPSAMVGMLEGMGADAIGANCSLGPDQLVGVMEEYLEYASVPVLIKPNAGLPKVEDGKTVYDVLPPEFAESIKRLVEKGVRIVGGCCGTTPDYIKAVDDALSVSANEDGKDLAASGVTSSNETVRVKPVEITEKGRSLISSYTHAVEFGKTPILIGERINPTGKKRFKQALRENDIDYILGEGLKQVDAGVHALDVNVGLPEIDEVAMIKQVVTELQAVTDLPLQIDTSDPVAMEAALRIYNGKAMVNSVNGKNEVMEAVFPLVAKYGGFVVALTLDENGIPETAQGRVAIAEKILKKAAEYGIKKKDIIFDPLAMTISADTKAALATMKAVHDIRYGLGVNTSLGVSNVSFGLPARNVITSTFFAVTLAGGLSAAIMNPFSREMMQVYYSFKALHDMDPNCAEYIEYESNLPQLVPAGSEAAAGINGASGNPGSAGAGNAAGASSAGSGGNGGSSSRNVSPLQNAVIRGLREKAGAITDALLKEMKPLEIVQQEIIPALNIVGEDFEAKKVYLPQLLMAAEASKEAFEKIKAASLRDSAKDAADDGNTDESADTAGKDRDSSAGADKNETDNSRFKIVIATVHGDIHDIGKNIVKLILENYGFSVVDLGKDVPEQDIVDKAVEIHADMVGLSALMTTTVPAMENTIKLLRDQAPWVKVAVGGAVMTQKYSDSIGADRFCRDAMETVRYAEELNKSR
ncbi:MAG: homocysteine S-methyltransferase family protein [Eubacterium sp.]|nr:homocysteine S-methyltransferase family protein [Eubacterium sp.]